MPATPSRNAVMIYGDEDTFLRSSEAQIPVTTMLNQICPPAIKMMIGSTDTDQICDTAPFQFTLTKLLIQCVDTTTHTKGSLASEITITVYVAGVAKFSAISTATDTLVESVLTTPVDIAKGDVIAVVPSAAPGAGKQVSLNLVGTW